MGAKYKFSHYVRVPIDRSDVLNIVDVLENAIHVDDPRKPVTIAVTGSKNATVQLSSEQLAEIVEIMKVALND